MASLALNACKKEDFAYEKRFDRSYETWLKFKAASGNSYRYEVFGATWAWIRSSWHTTIHVRNGKVVRRDFYYEVFAGMQMPEGGWDETSVNELSERLAHPLTEPLQWTEMENELGSHETSAASRIQTLDEIYETARTQWLKKRDDAQISFETDNNGMISYAGFTPNGCVDDCFSGISIRSIEAIK